jgi:hypothetical protein
MFSKSGREPMKKLEEMESNAKPISDWIHPMHLRQLGTNPMAHAVTSEATWALLESRVGGHGGELYR